MRFLICIVLVALARGARDFVSDSEAGITLTLGLLLVVGYFVGELFERMRMPKLTGYILTGLALGPYGFGLIGAELGTLKLVNGTAIALIAMTAGSELDLRTLRPMARSILAIVTTGVVIAAITIAATAFASRSLFGFLADLDTWPALAICMVLGVALSAQSPAVVVALRKETRATGPLADTVLGAVVVGDMIVIVLFAIAQTVGRSALGATAAGNPGLHVLWHVVGSIAIGVIAGWALGAWLRRIENGVAILVLVSCVVLAEVGQRLALDPIVVAVVAGAFVRNRVHSAADALHRGLGASAAAMYVLFFAVAGASLHLDVLATLGVPAVMIVVARALGLFAGARLGGRWAHAEPTVRKWAGVGLLPQAGLAIALALVFAREFPELAESAVALALGVVALNELVAPALWRTVLIRNRADAEPGPEPGAEPPPERGGVPGREDVIAV